MNDVILLQDNDLTSNTLLGGNIDVDRFRYCILDAQASKLEVIYGDELYAKMIADFGTYAGEYLTLYNNYHRPFLIAQAAVEYLLVGAYQVANAGIFKTTPQNGSPTDKVENDYLVKNYKLKAKMYEERLVRYLSGSGIAEYTNTSVNCSGYNSGDWV